MSFDRSWIPGILALLGIIMLSNQLDRLPYIFQALIGLAGMGWLLWAAVQVWRKSAPPGKVGAQPRVQYWRGQRIVLDDTPQRKTRSRLTLPPWPTLLAGVLYGGIGLLGIIVLGAALIERLI